MSTGNARHQAAAQHTADRVRELRADIHTGLANLLELTTQLEDLAGTRQSVGIGFQTPEIQQARARQDAADRAAARGIPTHTDRSFIAGLAWIGADASTVPGIHEAPVTMPAVSAAAEILFTLQHHVRRLARPAVRVALRAEQTEAEDAGRCTWPRRTILADPPTTDGTTADLIAHLGRLVDVYASRPGLEHLLRELDHLEHLASEVVNGPAKTNHPDPCPWCGRTTLVVHHRAPGRDEMFIRCDGKHPCTCDDPWCPCQRNPVKHRHEWINSGRASNAVTGRNPRSLASLITTRKETAIRETKALDAVARALELHQPEQIYRQASDCQHPEQHEAAGRWIREYPEFGVLCGGCPPVDGQHCATCRDDDGGLVLHPCATAQALELDQPTEQPTTEETP